MGLDLVLLAEVEQFLYREARLLDEQRFHEWLDLFTDDVRYWVPVRESVLGGPEIALEEDTLALAHLTTTGRCWNSASAGSTPGSRTRRLPRRVADI